MSTESDIVFGEVDGVSYRVFTECYEPGFVYLEVTTQVGCRSCGKQFHKEEVKIPLAVYNILLSDATRAKSKNICWEP